MLAAYGESPSRCTTRRRSHSRRLQNSADDLTRQTVGLRVQGLPRDSHILFDGGSGFTNLLLGALPGLCYRRCSGLLRGLAPRFLSFEDGQPRFSQASLIFLSFGLGSRHVGARLQDCPFRAFAALVEDASEGPAHQRAV